MFIVEMTHKAYYYASKNNRKTLQRNDIAAAITDTEIYDFLLDIMPRDEMISSAKDKQLVRLSLTHTKTHSFRVPISCSY
jgi:nuclear transcription factor Y gamma